MREFVIKGTVFTAPALTPALYVAATPIGNLGDVTIRVLEALAGCDLIACEDTRVTGKLLRHYGINNKTVSYHEHNANTSGPKLLQDISNGKSVVLVSDAGTPVVSDPGLRLVTEAREQDIKVVPLPGASATITALVASGIQTESWTFAGFLPNKQSARISRLEQLANLPTALIFFESPNRLNKSLGDMIDVFGADRPVCVGREMTKLHEEIVTRPLGEIEDHFSNRDVKGEVVIVIAPPDTHAVSDINEVLSELLQTMSVSQAAAEAAQLTGASKRELYQAALALKENK